LAAKRLDFREGEPVVPVRLMEGNTEVVVASSGRLALGLQPPREVPAPAAVRVRWVSGTPADVVAKIAVQEVPFADKEGLGSALGEWANTGLQLKAQVLGGIYGIAGKVVDNRRYALVVDQSAKRPRELEPQQAQIFKQFSVRTSLVEEVRTPGTTRFEVVLLDGGVVGSGSGELAIDSPEGMPLEVRRVEYGVGYDFHNFEDRSFRGSLRITADIRGKLAVINRVPLEALLKGLVPSEIFAKAHPEALKAQAVTARGEVLAKVGLKHLADPYLLCTEQHCAVYKGVSGEQPTTSAAVEATRGEALFDAKGKLVDSVYSAVCGGHTEHNDVVWGGVANESLRGKPDILPGKTSDIAPSALTKFLSTEAAHACRLSSFTPAAKFRWEKRLAADDVDKKVAAAGHTIGRVFAMAPTDRGVSGRVRLLTLSGETGATQVRGELTIRRLFGNLNSAMFEVRLEKDSKGKPASWVFTGGGWGHGVGMCQTGAIGRAEAGQSYRDILQHYFSGAQVFAVYE
jgi:stage II sporulation protein D